MILLWEQEGVEDDDRGFLSEFLSSWEFKTFVEGSILLPEPLANIKSHRINPDRNLREFKCSVDQIIQECPRISQFFENVFGIDPRYNGAVDKCRDLVKGKVYVNSSRTSYYVIWGK